MATSSQNPAGPPPDQNTAPPPGAAGQGAGAATPSQAPASPLQMLLARWFETAKQMAASDPRLAAGMEKVAQGVQEAQTALMSPPQPTPMGQQPQY